MPRTRAAPVSVVRCLRCAVRMTPSSLGMLRLRLTSPGRSRLRKGVEAAVHVCPRCGHVEFTASEPEAFAPTEA